MAKLVTNLPENSMFQKSKNNKGGVTSGAKFNGAEPKSLTTIRQKKNPGNKGGGRPA